MTESSEQGQSSSEQDRQDIRVERGDGVVEVTFDRPHRHNAFTRDMYAQMRELCAELAEDPQTRVLVLRGAGGRAFAAGAMGGMHTGDKLSRMSDAQRRQCVDDFLTGLGDCFDGTAIRFPHVSNVITARA